MDADKKDYNGDDPDAYHKAVTKNAIQNYGRFSATNLNSLESIKECYKDIRDNIDSPSSFAVLARIFESSLELGSIELANQISLEAKNWTTPIQLEKRKSILANAFTESIKRSKPNIEFAKGGVIDAGNKITAYARGGIVNKPTLFPMANGMGLMGEAGPEGILPLKRGRDGKLGVMSQGGGSTNIVVNVDASGSTVEGDEDGGRELGRLISVAIQSELINQKRPGGLLA